VTLGDEEARRRGTQKTVLERKAPPTFDVVVEIQDWSNVVVHPNVAETVDALLRGNAIDGEVRVRDETGHVHVESSASEAAPTQSERSSRTVPQRSEGFQPLSVFPFGVSRKRLEQAVREMRVPVSAANRAIDADLVITLRSYYRSKPESLRDAEAAGIPVYVLRNNTVGQMQNALASVFNISGQTRDPSTTALEEAEQAIGDVLEQSRAVEVAAQNAHIRRLQHQLAERYNVGSRSRGKEPNRRVKFFPREYEGLI
jgi:R3H domain